MNKRNIIGNTLLFVGLLAAGTSFAAEADTVATTPAKVQERSTYRNQEQNAEKQQNKAQYRNELKEQEGKGEMNRERARSGEMRNSGGSLPR